MTHLRSVLRLFGALALALFGFQMLWTGISGIMECSRPPMCSEDSVGIAASFMGVGFLCLLGVVRLVSKRNVPVRRGHESDELRRPSRTRRFAGVMLASMLMIAGVSAAMMLGPAYLVISRGSDAERPEGIVMALVAAPVALACLLGVRWIQQRTRG